MRTTIDIFDPLLERAKAFAAGRGKNLADVVNDALLEKLGREESVTAHAKPFKLPTFGTGGLRPGVDLNSNASLQELLDEDARDPAAGKLDLKKLR